MAIVVDTSALAAVIFGEQDAPAFAAALVSHAGDVMVSAATLVECEIVVESRQGSAALQDLGHLITRVSVDVVAFDRQQAVLASAAWRRFGKGRHSAGLNLGDCYSYALSKYVRAPLLYKGSDFTRTDVESFFG